MNIYQIKFKYIRLHLVETHAVALVAHVAPVAPVAIHRAELELTTGEYLPVNAIMEDTYGAIYSKL